MDEISANWSIYWVGLNAKPHVGLIIFKKTLTSSTKNQCTTLSKKIMLFGYAIICIYMFLINILDISCAVANSEEMKIVGGIDPCTLMKKININLI